MPEYQVKIVDAFTTRRYAGNPCGVVTRAEGLSDAQMQAIARELNSSETAFVFPSAVADFRVRFFTPLKEIPLAGHPTIATMHALAEEGRIDLSGGPRRVTQELNAGTLPVAIEPLAVGGCRVTMTQAPPRFLQALDSAPAPDADSRHHDVYQNYEIEAERRDDLKQHLEAHGIRTIIQFGGKAVHQYEGLGLTQHRLPRTELLYRRALLLPMNTSLSDEDVGYVTDRIRHFYGRR